MSYVGDDALVYEDGYEDRSVMSLLSLSFTKDVRGGCSRDVRLKG